MVEDNPADVFLIQQALRAHNVSAAVIVMQDGEAGYRFIEQVDHGEADPPDVFILDLSLPRRSGPELLDRIKDSPACSRARVVIASSSHNPSDKSSVVEADYYFVKPSSFYEFMKIGEVVSELLDRAA